MVCLGFELLVMVLRMLMVVVRQIFLLICKVVFLIQKLLECSMKLWFVLIGLFCSIFMFLVFFGSLMCLFLLMMLSCCSNFGKLMLLVGWLMMMFIVFFVEWVYRQMIECLNCLLFMMGIVISSLLLRQLVDLGSVELVLWVFLFVVFFEGVID